MNLLSTKEMKMKVFKVAFIVSMISVALAWPVDALALPQFSLVQKSDEQVQLVVRKAKDLSAFEIELSFDDVTGKKGTKFRLKSVSPANFLKKSPRSFTQVGPKISADGKITFGFFSFGTNPGLKGGGALAIIKCSGDASKLRITNVKATDSMGNQLACGF
jgi:hypothetical protein